MHSEVELKLDLDHTSAAAIEASGLHQRACTNEQMRSRYFDTPEFALRDAGLSLRLRESNGQCIQTIKADGAAGTGLFERAEWEMPAPGADPVSDPRTPLASLLAKQSGDLVELFTITVERKTWRVTSAKGEVAMMLDRGEVRSAERSEQFCELELELFEGEATALFELARKIGAVAPVRIGVLSKAARGYRLRAPLQVSVKSNAPRLDPAGNLKSAFVAITQHCIGHYRHNETILLNARSVEAVHQARIALRRLRSALSLFRSLVPLDETEMFQARLRSLAATLGEARDFDVMCALAESGPIAHRLAAARDKAYDQLAAALADSEARRLMLDLVAWLFCGTWRQQLTDGAIRETSPREFAHHALDRAYRKVRKHSKHLASLDAEARHELRKDAKKLRYTIDFLSPLYGSRAQLRHRKKFVDAFTALLASLGALNDRKVAENRLAQLGLAGSKPAETLLAHWDQPRLLEIAGDARARLFDLKPFWR